MRGLTISDPALLGSTRYRDTVLADSPAGYWPLDDTNSTMRDISGNAKNGSYTGSPTLSAGSGPGGRDARVFNGSTQYGSVAAPVVTTEQPLTAEFWLKFTNTALRVPLTLRNPVVAGEVLVAVLALSTAGHMSAYRQSGTGTATWASAINNGAWHHVVMTVNSANNDLSLWVDGTLRATDTTPGDPTTSTSNIALWVGCNNAGSATQFFDGSMSDVAVYTSALSSDRIAAHYNAGR